MNSLDSKNYPIYPEYTTGVDDERIYMMLLFRFKYEGKYYLHTFRADGNFNEGDNNRPSFEEIVEVLKPYELGTKDEKNFEHMLQRAELDEYQGELPNLELN